jgi:hypothetical protein
MLDLCHGSTDQAVLDICIARPEKTETRYCIPITVTDPDGRVRQHKIGLHDSNFVIPHHEIWDSFLPLMWLSRNGGPLFNKPITCARVRAEYPLHSRIARFFEARATAFGLRMQVDGPEFERSYDVRTQGEMLLFGGGKDSRLLLGALREIGRDPGIISARGGEYARDLPEALCFEPLNFSMPNRIVPALMLCPRIVYQGCGLGEVHHHSPWQQHFDISAPEALRATSELLQSLGFDITLTGPQGVLPYNVTQNILLRRYPALAAGQISVTPHKASDKNLQVTLLKRYHGFGAEDHCSAALFDQMLAPFVQKALDLSVPPFGHQANREMVEREMRAIIWRLYGRGELDLPAPLAPQADWDAAWIEYIHAYRDPAVCTDLLGIYRQYADIWPVARAAELPDCLRVYCGGSGSHSAGSPA